MVATQQNGQVALAQFVVHGVVHRPVPGRDFVQVAVAFDRRLPGVGRAVQIAAVDDLEALGLDHGAQIGHAQGLGAHGGAAGAGADVGGRADERDAAGQVGGMGMQVALRT